MPPCKMKDHPRQRDLVAAWRAGTGPAEGTTTYGAGQPTRDYYSIYLLRDGTVTAYAHDFEFHLQYLARYGKHDPACRWSYDVPPQTSVVFTLDDREIQRTADEGAGSHLAAFTARSE